MTVRSGAEALVSAATAAGIEVCFTNPGTTELPIVAAMSSGAGLRPILVLFEGVAAGAADGYGRVTGRPAVTLLHLGAGLGNAVANLHNARRARTPLVNVVGDQATWHAPYPSTLASNIAGLARPVSAFVRRIASSDRIPEDVYDAVRAALGGPGSISTLIVPHNCQWEPCTTSLTGDPPAPFWGAPDEDNGRAAAKALGVGPKATLYLGGNSLSARGLRAAWRIQSATGCGVFTETFPARMDRGLGIPHFPPLPYFPEAATAALVETQALVTAGVDPPVTIFATPDTPRPEVLPAGSDVIPLSTPGQDSEVALEFLADYVGGAAYRASVQPTPARPDDGTLTPRSIANTLASLLPEGAIVVDEASTCSYAFQRALAGALPHVVLSLTGGAIGMGLPASLGAAIGAPARRVIALQADGSALYTPQALWTMAREQLDVTVLLLSNRRYNILQIELERAGLSGPLADVDRLTWLTDPEIDWVHLAAGLGVPATRATTNQELSSQLNESLARRGPCLIEADLQTGPR